MLLSYCKWDKILLTEKFYADPDKLFKEARVLNPFNVLITADSPINECEICYDDLSTSVRFQCSNIGKSLDAEWT